MSQQATNGQITSLEQANTLTDNQGKPLEWKQDKDNPTHYAAKGTNTPFAKWEYALDITPSATSASYIVTVTKTPKTEKARQKAKDKINKGEDKEEEVVEEETEEEEEEKTS